MIKAGPKEKQPIGGAIGCSRWGADDLAAAGDAEIIREPAPAQEAVRVSDHHRFYGLLIPRAHGFDALLLSGAKNGA